MTYWYPNGDAAAVETLQALRRFHGADFAMRVRLRTDMGMNETDLRALRHLISAEGSGTQLGPTELTRLLGVSTAATAKLLARLVASGHIDRRPNPRDNRAQILHATDAAHREVRATLAAMHERMLAVAEDFSAEERATLVRFLDALTAAVTVTVVDASATVTLSQDGGFHDSSE